MAKLRQANPVKFYLAKFFFLGFALLLWGVSLALALRFGTTPKNTAGIIIFGSLGCIFIVLFFFLSEAMRRVAIGKDRIVVIGGKNTSVTWPEVKSIKLIPVFNIYKMKLKNRRKAIYFLPSKNIEPAYDLLAEDTSKMGDIVNKNKKKLGI